VDANVWRNFKEVRTDVREFFAVYAAAGDGDPAASADLFCDPFLNLDPVSAGTVTRAQFTASLPMRARMFSSIGAEGTDLIELSEQPIDEQHTLVRTAWAIRFADTAAEPLTLRSSFLLHRAAVGWRIAAYINHLDLDTVIRARSVPGGE
jgi:hypothetical protein